MLLLMFQIVSHRSLTIREYRVTMAKNLIGCWGSPAANQILRHSNPLFGQLHNKKQIKEQ